MQFQIILFCCDPLFFHYFVTPLCLFMLYRSFQIYIQIVIPFIILVSFVISLCMCVANHHNVSSSCLIHYLFFWCVLAPHIYICNLFVIMLQIVKVHIYKVLFWLLVLLVQCHSILLHLELVNVCMLQITWVCFQFILLLINFIQMSC